MKPCQSWCRLLGNRVAHQLRVHKRAISSEAAAQKWSVTLNTGAKMPAFGLGTWQSKPGEVGASVEAALKVGYRHIDSAQSYRNDAEIGEALQRCFKEGVVKREDVFVTSKLINSAHAKEDILPALQSILGNLQLDYLDLFLVHWPLALARGASPPNLTNDQRLGYNEEREAKCWEVMEELYSKGLAKAIGISNFSITKTETLLKTAKIVPAVNQVECHPYFQQQKLKDYCDSKGISVMAYSPLGAPGNTLTKGVTRVIDDPVIKDIADKHRATVAQVCLSFGLHRGMVVIPKSVSMARIAENLKATELKLDAEDMRRLKGIERFIRYVKGDVWLADKWGDIDEYLWDTTKDKNFQL